MHARLGHLALWYCQGCAHLPRKGCVPCRYCCGWRPTPHPVPLNHNGSPYRQYRSDLDDRIIAVLAQAGVPLTTREVAAALGHDRYSDEGLRIYRHLKTLTRKGRLHRWRNATIGPAVSWSTPTTITPTKSRKPNP